MYSCVFLSFFILSISNCLAAFLFCSYSLSRPVLPDCPCSRPRGSNLLCPCGPVALWHYGPVALCNEQPEGTGRGRQTTHGYSPVLAGVVLRPVRVAVPTLQHGEGAPLPLLSDGLLLLLHGRRLHHVVHEALAPPLRPWRRPPCGPGGGHQFGPQAGVR